LAQLAHVFVCYGTVSLDAAVRIAGTLQAPAEALYFLVLFKADLSRLPARAHRYQLDARRYSEWTRAFRIATWYRAILADLEAQVVDEIVAYLPHPFELPGNDLIYFDARVRRRELLPDGLINYVSSNVVPSRASRRVRYFARVLMRSLAARFVRLRYRALSGGSVTQVGEVSYDRAWCDVAQGFQAPSCGTTFLPARTGGAKSAARTGTLLLDQELHELVSEALETKLRLKLGEVSAEFAAGPVYYKAHPRGKNRAREFAPRVRDVSQQAQAEDLFESLALERIVGFYSTPLLFPQQGVERIAILPELGCQGVRKPELLEELHAVLAGAGTKLLTVA
jgi:hypothetical protein